MIWRVAESCARTIHIRDGHVFEDVRTMILLRLISWPYARKHLLRTLLTIAGHRARRRGVRRRCTRPTRACSRRSGRPSIASPGQTQLQISAGEPGFRRRACSKRVAERRRGPRGLARDRGHGFGGQRQSADSRRRHAGRSQPAHATIWKVPTRHSTIRWCFLRSRIR